MNKVRLTIPDGATISTGKQLTFTAPCDCSETECLQINGVDYAIVDAKGYAAKNSWSSGNIVSIIVDTKSHNAYVQNSTSLSPPIYLTQAEYDAITPKDPEQVYIITDDTPTYEAIALEKIAEICGVEYKGG